MSQAILYTIKHLRGNFHTSSTILENFSSLPTTAYFSVIITKRKVFSGKTFVLSENMQNRESFPPQTFVLYTRTNASGSLREVSRFYQMIILKCIYTVFKGTTRLI